MEEQNYCAKHKKEPTELRCGKCDRFICHKCLSLSPAGTRCHECARNKVEFRPRAVGADLKLGFRRILQMAPYQWYMYVVIGSLIIFAFRSCAMQNDPAPLPPVETEQSQQGMPV